MKRRRATVALLVLGAMLLVGSVLFAYVSDVLVDSDEFADATASAFATEEVQAAVSQQVVDQLVETEPDLLLVRPLLESIVEGILGSDLAEDVVRAGVADLHRSVFSDDVDTVSFQLADIILVAKTQLTALDPEIGALIPDELTDALVDVQMNELAVDLVQFAEDVWIIALVLPLLSIASFWAAVWLSRRRGHTVTQVGLIVVAVAGFLILSERVVRRLLISGADDEALAGAIWDAYLADFGSWLVVLAAAGAILALLAWWGVTADVSAQMEAFRHWARTSESKWLELTVGLVTMLVGIAFVVYWEQSVRFLASLVGAGLIALGLRRLLRALIPLLRQAPSSMRAAWPEDRRTKLLSALGAVAAVALAGIVVIAVWQSVGTRSAEATDPRCNGTVLLCEKRFDEVALAATHNSHAAAEDGFTFGYQTVGMLPQLEDGVRALLIDVYFGLALDNGSVVTDRAPLTEAEREELVDEIGESAVVAAEAMVVNTAAAGGERDLYLCHALCEIGAVKFLPELEKVKQFLDENPSEVIAIVVQDEGPTPDDIANAFTEAGLEGLSYDHTPGDPWPTLREMIDNNTRLFASAENQSGDVPWYHDTFTFVQDTPFKFERPEEFSCDLNRGSADNDLLLVNHWLSPVSPASADQVNTQEMLEERVQQCLDDRGLLPNMIAVDFHDRGQLVEFVEDLNLRIAGG